MITIQNRYRELLNLTNEPLTVDQARQLQQLILRVPADYGGINPELAEHSGLLYLSDYAQRKAALAVEWAEDRSTRLDLADIERDLFEELDRMEADLTMVDVALRYSKIEDLRSRLGRITRNLPERDHIRSLFAFADVRYEVALETAREPELQATVQPERVMEVEYELDISESYWQR